MFIVYNLLYKFYCQLGVGIECMKLKQNASTCNINFISYQIQTILLIINWPYTFRHDFTDQLKRVAGHPVLKKYSYQYYSCIKLIHFFSYFFLLTKDVLSPGICLRCMMAFLVTAFTKFESHSLPKGVLRKSSIHQNEYRAFKLRIGLILLLNVFQILTFLCTQRKSKVNIFTIYVIIQYYLFLCKPIF